MPFATVVMNRVILATYPDIRPLRNLIWNLVPGTIFSLESDVPLPFRLFSPFSTRKLQVNAKMPSKAKSKHEQGNFSHPYSPLRFYIVPDVMI